MKMKKINAALGLLTILFMIAHITYIIFAYLTFYYNPFLKTVFAVPFMVLVCLHAVCGMMVVFTQGDGTRLDLYPKQNKGTILQRATAALILPLLIMHLNMNSMIIASVTGGRTFFVPFLIAAEIFFFAVVITHVAVSLTKGLVTLGILTSRDTQKTLDKIIYIIGAIAFIVAIYAVVKGQIIMFVMG